MAILSSTDPTVYFDNCLVGAVVKNDHPDQMPALSALLRQHELGVISAVASTEVLGEIGALPEQYQARTFTCGASYDGCRVRDSNGSMNYRRRRRRSPILTT
jgi:hypothetical protein